jgi:hypothetical protein
MSNLRTSFWAQLIFPPNAAGVHVKLTEEEIKYLEEPYQPQAIFGHW